MRQTENGAPPPRRWQLLSYGDPCADIVLAAERPPELGGKVLGRPLGVLAGGTTANVACAAARLGLRSAVYGRTGADPHGDLLRASFEQFGVDHGCLRRDAGEASASAIVIVAPGGEKSVIYQPMAAAPPDPLELAEAVARAELVYAMPYGLEEFDLLSTLARRHGALVAIDLEAAVAPDVPAMRLRASRADIVFFNQAGFEAGTGMAPGETAMRAVLALGPRLVVVSMGAAGAMAASAGDFASQDAFPATVVDTAGAGDSFNAAFLAAWRGGADLARALRFACAAASCTVAALGARTALPARAAVEAVLAREAGGTPARTTAPAAAGSGA
ncbi:carbohydrate kinase family protein [Pseudoduganella namucuonensis]|uniref:Ribokinase n=1 Tax=Pseudoduganella namucuonensis TaxID=1035707 RepID=A0A1I7K8Q6_9BURK|nr:carbohydrate kinase family protein [Pseudoduganella namucuonensis]SFU93824.1 ribokinase [Pseudoduganella namucuonensis]